MPEFFISATTFAAPFVSDRIDTYEDAATPQEAVLTVVERHRDGIGIYAANAFASADAYHKKQSPLAQWRCNRERLIRNAIDAYGAISVASDWSDRVEINGELHTIDGPKEGGFI